MIDLIRQMLDIARQEAEAHPEAPRERCGVILEINGQRTLRECENVHETPTDNFSFSPREWAQMVGEGHVIEIWHTHPGYSAAPSMADRVVLEKLGLPWHIVSWPDPGHSYTLPCGYEAPLEGRTFAHGILDCYTLVQDWYQRQRGITLPDFERKDKWWEDPDGPDLYVDNFAKAGFYEVEPEVNVKNLEIGDVLLMHAASRKTNHAAVYVGEGRILHHLYGKVSLVQPYGGDWLKRTTHHLRYGKKNDA